MKTSRTKDTIEVGTHSVANWPLRFKAWAGAPVLDTFGGKAILDWNDEPVFAELAIVRALQAEGFDAVWIDGYRNLIWSSMSEPRTLPEHAKALMEKVVRFNGGRRQGCWDVLAWKGEDFMFVESKRKGKDSIKETQVRWLDAALRAGMDTSCFRICEWDLANSLG